MKKQNLHFSIAKSLLILVALLFSFSQPSFAQEDEGENETTEQAEAQSSSEGGDAARGKELFQANCASCHQRYKRSTGPALYGTLGRVPSRQWLYDWIHNSTALIKSGDSYANKIFDEFNQSAMTHFPQLSEEDIDDILAYTEQPKAEPTATAATEGAAATGDGGSGVSNTIVLGILALVLVLLVVILALVNKTLTRFAEERGIAIHGPEKEVRKPLWKMIVENQFIAIVFSIVVMLVGSYWVYFFLMQVGVDQGYEPVQPIHYSHRIHAGDNQIDCKYCHYTARKSETAGIPSLNACMNCHMAISEVSEDTATEEYSKAFYDGEIAKLYDAVGWDPDTHQYTGKTKPVKWVRIHNLPDLAYFNHSQHVEVGQLDCQQCHGPVEEMEIVRQEEKLTMGWCIECHRTTNVKMEGNKYYEKIHEQLSKKYGVEQLTEAQMGGLECGRCHY